MAIFTGALLFPASEGGASTTEPMELLRVTVLQARRGGEGGGEGGR
jgi:hypothetical protein